MKKMMLLGVLMLSAAAGYAQESRQDVSFSGTGLFGPEIHGAGNVTVDTTGALGLLTSYRYMVTPHSALELNYSFTQDQFRYRISTNIQANYPGYAQGQRIHSREQEATGAYVYSRTYRRYNPFLEAGVGLLLFTPILDNGTQILGAKSTKGIAGLFGGGLAYELSPSFDLRVEYRGFINKTPSFGFSNFNANRYEVLSMPTVGVAYHF